MSIVEIGITRGTASESLPELAAGLAIVVLTMTGERQSGIPGGDCNDPASRRT
jgi:hypothetical protein